MIASGLLVSLLGWSSVFGWYVWGKTFETKSVFEFRPKHFVKSFSYDNAETRQAMNERLSGGSLSNPNDVHLVTLKIRATSDEPISIIDNAFILAAFPPPVWNAFHGAANYYYLPDEWRRALLANTAERLKRSGWVIFIKTLSAEWLEDYKSVYNVTEEIDGGSYFAVHLVPKKRARPN